MTKQSPHSKLLRLLRFARNDNDIYYNDAYYNDAYYNDVYYNVRL